MDRFKEATMKNYTAWDLNADCVVMKNKKRKALIDKFKRNARREMRQELRKGIER